jgi:hypothetical protein
MKPQKTSKCKNPYCQAPIPEGESFCDPLCMEEYENSKCIDCGEIEEQMHTVTNPEEFLGRKICYDCYHTRMQIKSDLERVILKKE